MMVKYTYNISLRYGIALFVYGIFFIQAIFASGNAEQESRFHTSIVGIMLPSQRERYWVQLKDSFTHNFSNKSLLKEKDFTQLFFYSDMDALLQEEQLNDLYIQKAEVVILAPVHEMKIGRVLNKSKFAQFAIISLHDMILNTHNIDYFIGYNYYEFGTLLSKAVLDIYHNQRIIFISDKKQFTKSLLEGIVAQGLYVESFYLETDISKQYTMQQIDAILASYEGNLIIISDNVMLLDSIDDYVSNRKMESIWFAGIGSSSKTFSRFKKNIQIIALIKDTQELANIALDVAYSMINNKIIPYTTTINNGKKQVKSTYVSPKVLNLSNYQEALSRWEK